MKIANINTHFELESLKSYGVPESTRTHKPITHYESALQVRDEIESLGYIITGERHEVSAKGLRCISKFCTNIAESKTQSMCIYLTNANDKKFARKVGVMTYQKVCSNSMVREVGLESVKHKHTNRLIDQFDTSVVDAVRNIIRVGAVEINTRIERMKATELSKNQANQILIDCFVVGVLPSSKFKDVHNEYWNPRHREFSEMNLWAMENSFTEYMKGISMEKLIHSSRALEKIMVKNINQNN